MTRFILIFLLLIASSAHADTPLRISICGHSAYDCPQSDEGSHNSFSPSGLPRPGDSGNGTSPGGTGLAPGDSVPSVEVDTNKPGSTTEPTVTVPTSGGVGAAAPAPQVSGTAEPTLPGGFVTQYKLSGLNWQATKAEACQEWATYANNNHNCTLNGQTVYTQCTVTNSEGTTCILHCQCGTNTPTDPYADYQSQGINTNPTCPAGYSYNATIQDCVLDDARQAQADGKVDFKKAADGGYEKASENDADGAANPRVTTPGSPKRIEVAGYDSGGRPVQLSVSGDGNGGTNLLYTQGSNPLSVNNNTVNQYNYNINANGIVVGASRTEGSGNLIINQTTGQATIVPSGTGSGLQNSDGTNPGVEPRSFPSDYAREGTLRGIKDALTQSATAPSDPTARTATEIEDQFFKTTFTGLKSWSLPAHSSSCPTASFEAFGATRTLNSHCALINDHWGLLSAVMLVVWTISALFIVMRA